MTSIYHDKKKNGWRLETYVKSVRRKLWLGAISKSQADTIKANIHALKLAFETGTTCERHVLVWTNRIDKRLADQLAIWLLIEPRDAQASTIKLSAWLRDYLANPINATWSKSTRYQMTKVSELLLSQLGDKSLDRVNEADAEVFSRYVYGLESISESHAGKQVKRAKQFFHYAVKKRILEKNPFGSLRASTQIDATRKAYISPEAAEKIMEQLPSQLWRVLFALARFAGLRMPSEPLALEWNAVDWTRSRLTVTAPKQIRHKHRAKRVVPLSPSVIRELLALSEQSAEGETYIVNKYRSANTSQFRKPLLQAIQKAGFEDWPKLWTNLRASCRTDWLKINPPHVVNQWLGHDGKVGEKHYDRITDGDWATVTTPTIAPTTDENIKKRGEKPA